MSRAFPEKWFKLDGEQKNSEEFYAWIKNHVENDPVVKNHHGKWIELMAWEEGDQFTEWRETARKVVPVELTTRIRRVVSNFMKPLLETIDGKINFAHQIVGMPNSGERKDVDGAVVATKLLTFNDDVTGAPSIMDEMKWDMLRTGTGCIRWFWNGSKHARAAGKKGDSKDVSGDVDCYSPNIFNVRPDSAAKSQAEMRYHIEIKEITRDAALATYDNIDPAWLVKGAERVGEEKYRGLNVERSEIDRTQATFMVYEFIEHASVDYPKGRLIIYLDDHCVHADHNPNPDAELGFYYYYFRKSKKSFWGTGPLYYVQADQRNLNRTLSMQCEHVEAWRPKVGVGPGALARANSLTIGSFEVVEFANDRGDIKVIPTPPLSSTVSELRDYFLASKDMTSNVHEVSYARLPQYASRAPNSLYQSMLEQESIKLDPLIKRTNKTLVDSARFRLKLMDQHYTDKRMVKILGPNKIASIGFFDKTDLNGNYDVQLEIGVSMNQSTSMQNRLVLDLWDKKVFQGERDRIKLLKILNLGSAEAELRSDLVDSDRAQRENQAFQEGRWRQGDGTRGVYVLIHDNHEVHLESHTNLLKSAEAEMWDDETMTAFMAHIDEHYQFWIQLQNAANAQAPAGEGEAAAEMPGTPEEEFAQEEAERSGPPPQEGPGQGAPMPV